MDIVEIIKLKMEERGISSTELAERISCSKAQVSLFLNNKSSLNINSLNKCFEFLGINFSQQHKRHELAKAVAEYFDNSEESIKQLRGITKKELVDITKRNEILNFIDVESKEDYEKIKKDGLFEIEATFPYFRTMVIHYVIIPENEKLSRSKIIQSWTNAAECIGLKDLVFPLGIFGLFALGCIGISRLLFNDDDNSAKGETGDFKFDLLSEITEKMLNTKEMSKK